MPEPRRIFREVALQGVKSISSYESTDMHCPNCGKQDLWTAEPGDDFRYYCLSCKWTCIIEFRDAPSPADLEIINDLIRNKNKPLNEIESDHPDRKE